MSEETKAGMPQADVDFLMACLRNTSGGTNISVSTHDEFEQPYPLGHLASGDHQD